MSGIENPGNQTESIHVSKYQFTVCSGAGHRRALSLGFDSVGPLTQPTTQRELMFHYPHHIGDFNKATRHLTRLERSIYRDLLDLYYETESQLPLDISFICRRIIANTNEERTAVEQTLSEFFHKTPDGWYQKRCEDEIDRFRSNISQKALAGKASAAKRAEKLQRAFNGRSTGVERMLNGTPTALQRRSNGAPTNQEPEPEPMGEAAM